MKVTYSIVFVSNMSRSVAFYRDLVGIPLKFESPEWTEFCTGEATLALHKANSQATGPGHDKSPGTCRPGFGVSDLDAFHQRMIDAEITCLQAPRDLHGTRIAQYADPDGLILSIGESG